MTDIRGAVKPANEKVISPAVIKRLPRYYRYLGDLLKNGVVRISSKELSERMNVTASINNIILIGLVLECSFFNESFLQTGICRALFCNNQYDKSRFLTETLAGKYAV